MNDIDTLITRLASPDPATRLAAAEQLARAGEAAAPAAVALVKACGDADDQVREQAVAALEELGAPPLTHIADLTTLAAAADPLVAYWAITLLGRSGQAAAAAVKTLTERLASVAAPEVAQRAAWALGKIGPAAAAAADALRTAAGSADPRLARLAGEALTLVGG
ncbi:MAG: HEAT repeat domain-containing protein [Planctomycetota bacterium]